MHSHNIVRSVVVVSIGAVAIAAGAPAVASKRASGTSRRGSRSLDTCGKEMTDEHV